MTATAPLLRIRAFRLISAYLRYGWKPCRLARLAITQRNADQRGWELAGLIGRVACRPPRVVVEIGTRRGGTLFCWSQIAAEDALLVSLDLPAGGLGGGCDESTITTLKGYLKKGQTLEWLRDDSHAPSSLAWLRQVLGPRPIDFLFIDGDHTYAGVKQDFEMYSPLVAAGGLIAFHDIVPHASDPSNEVYRFWREIRDRNEVLEFIDPNCPPDSGMGIGVIVKK